MKNKSIFMRRLRFKMDMGWDYKNVYGDVWWAGWRMVKVEFKIL